MSELFELTFETGDLSEFTSTATDGGDLYASAAAARFGSYGLAALIDDTNALTARKNVTKSAYGWRCRVYFDPNSVTMANNDQFIIAEVRQDGGSYSGMLYLNLKYTTAAGYQLVAQCYNDAGSDVMASTVAITDDWHYIEIRGTSATGAAASDGSYEWWIDGVSKKSVTSVDNYNRFQDYNWRFYLACEGVDAGTSGTVYWDNFRANDDGGVIGPIFLGTTTATLGAVTCAGAGTLTASGASGTLTATLGTLTSTAAGALTISASKSATLGALTSTGTGALTISGSAVKTLGTLTSTGAGALTIIGTATKTLGVLTSTGAGGLTISGSTAQTLGVLTSAASGALTITASKSITLGVLTSTGAGALQISASATITLGALTSTGAGQLALAGALNKTLGALTSQATGSLTNTGALDKALGGLTLTGTGAFGSPVSGALNAALGELTAAATGVLKIAGATSQTLGGLTAAGTGQLEIVGSVSVALDALVSAGAGALDIAGALTSTLGELTVTGSGSGSYPEITGQLTLTLAALVLVATGRGVAQRKANYYAVGDDVIDVKPSNYRANSRPSYRTKRKVYEAKNGDIS